MKPSDSPITVEEWQDGIDPGLFVKWLYPEDFQEVLENFVPLLVIPEGPENSRKRVRFWVATKRIREKLNDDLKREYELKYLPLDDPAAKWKSVPPHRYPEIVKQVSYRLSGIPKTFKLQGCDRPVPVRVFRCHVGKMGTAKAKTDCTKWLERLYHAWIEVGEPPGMSYEEWIKVGRPTTRLKKDRWLAADDEFNEPGNERLTRHGFEGAWGAAEIPEWKKVGKITRRLKT